MSENIEENVNNMHKFSHNINKKTDNLYPSASGSERSSRFISQGTVIDGKYEIVSKIGSGGFASVYKAHHRMLDRFVAIKVMDNISADDSFRERFLREAQIAARFANRNIVSVYDFGTIENTELLYIVMELLTGHDLYAELYELGAPMPLSPQRAFRLLRPVLDALGEGHKLGIIHKDLKPENLFIISPASQNEHLKVVDFGVARMEGANCAKLTVNGNVMGTPRFMAPEYILQQLVTPAIDVYQMALIFSEALTCKSAVSENPVEAMKQHTRGEIRIADFLQSGPLKNIFVRALALNPANRFPTCDEFGKALDGVKDYFDISKLPVISAHPIGTKLNNPELDALFLHSNADRSKDTYHINIDKNAHSHDSTHKIASLNNDVKTSDIPTAQFIKDEKSEKTVKFLLILLFILFAFALAAFFTAFLLSRYHTDSVPPVTKSEQLYHFVFTANPSVPAQIIIGRDPVIRCTAPCQKTFSDDELPVHLTFEAEGYESGGFDISKTLHKNTDGIIIIDLMPNAPEPQAEPLPSPTPVRPNTAKPERNNKKSQNPPTETNKPHTKNKEYIPKAATLNF